MSALRRFIDAIGDVVTLMWCSLTFATRLLWKWTLGVVLIVVVLDVLGYWSLAAWVLALLALLFALLTWAERDAQGDDGFPSSVPIGWLIVAAAFFVFGFLL